MVKMSIMVSNDTIIMYGIAHTEFLTFYIVFAEEKNCLI